MGVGYTFFMTANALPGAIGGRWPRRNPQADAAIERGDTLGLKTGQLESRRMRAHIAQLQGDHEAVLEYPHQIEELLEGTDEAAQPVWMSPTHVLPVPHRHRPARRGRATPRDHPRDRPQSRHAALGGHGPQGAGAAACCAG